MKAVVKVPVCPIFPQPSAHSPLADEALHGMTVDVVQRPSAGWCKVITHYGYGGYAPDRCLLFDRAAVAAWASLPKKVVYLKNTCDVLAEPRVQSWLVETLTRGALVHAEDGEETPWRKVVLCDGRVGYTRSSFLSEYYEKPPLSTKEAFRRRLTDTALLYMGAQYRWGGKTPLGIDCSGLTFMAYLLNGVIIWRDAQIREGYPIGEIPRADVKRGDLLFFPGHVAMYLDNSRYIHSTGLPGSDGVTVNSLDPSSPVYRADLARSLLRAGSLFHK